METLKISSLLKEYMSIKNIDKDAAKSVEEKLDFIKTKLYNFILGYNEYECYKKRLKKVLAIVRKYSELHLSELDKLTEYISREISDNDLLVKELKSYEDKLGISFEVLEKVKNNFSTNIRYFVQEWVEIGRHVSRKYHTVDKFFNILLKDVKLSDLSLEILMVNIFVNCKKLENFTIKEYANFLNHDKQKDKKQGTNREDRRKNEPYDQEGVQKSKVKEDEDRISSSINESIKSETGPDKGGASGTSKLSDSSTATEPSKPREYIQKEDRQESLRKKSKQEKRSLSLLNLLKYHE